MKDKHLVDLILNRKATHTGAIKKALNSATHLDCIVAFAKYSGLSEVMDVIQARLKKGLVARFGVGLSFYQTEPEVLAKLHRLSAKHNLVVYVSDTGTNVTFHPKIYATTSAIGGRVLIGSANLTGGGLSSNVEASALIDDPSGTLFTKVVGYFDGLVKDESLVKLTDKRLADYRAAYVIHERYRDLLQRRAKRAVAERHAKPVLLSDFLTAMQEDESDAGYAAQCELRRKNAIAARTIVRAIGHAKPLDAIGFEGQLDKLLARFHSSGISRSKSKLVDGRRGLRKSFGDAYDLVSGDKSVTPGVAYGRVRECFMSIKGAGVNLLTEVLHSLDPHRFAVMNQNAVSGLALAGFGDFPLRPLKSVVDAARYEKFCKAADKVRKELGLPDFSALDALFNYVYWQSDGDEAPFEGSNES